MTVTDLANTEDDLEVAETTYRAAVARWPAALVLVQIKMLDGYSLSSLSRSGASTEPRYVFASDDDDAPASQ